MKKSLILGAVLSITALSSFSGVGVTQAQDRYGNSNHQWRNDDWSRGYGVNARSFVGTWRLEERRNQGMGGLRANRQQLPQMIRVERDRGDLRVESARGRLLREIDLRGGDARDGRVQVVTTGFGGARVLETYTLRPGGHELVVQTTVYERRGSRQFTSIYDRA
jgi:hypothetical protein